MQEDLTIWKIFKNSFNKVYKDMLLKKEEVKFEDKFLSINKIFNDKNIKNNKILYIKINIENGKENNKLALLYTAKTTIYLEHFLLLGNSEINDEFIINEPTIDANQELIQMILKNAMISMSQKDIINLKMEIEEIKIINNIKELENEEYEKYTYFIWEQKEYDIDVKEKIYLLMDKKTSLLFHPNEKFNKNKDSNLNHIPENNYNADNVTIEIEDCDKTKRIYREELDNLRLLLGVELKLSVRIGSKKMLLKDVVNIDIGTTIELEQLASEPLEILVNEIKIAEGEIVVIDGKFGVQITKISSKVERLTKLRFKG